MSSDKYKNKYRVPTNRLSGYDYGANGCYHVTICTQNRIHYFGEIVETETVKTGIVKTDNYPSLHLPTHELSPLPPPHIPPSHKSLHKTKIAEIAEKFWLDIPNHFPFVILDQYVIMPNHIHGILIFNKSATQWQPNRFGRQSQNLGSVIRGFKSSLKRYANENNIDFAWQERFHDRIIRNDIGLNNARAYIFNNPANWDDDDLNENQ